MIPLIVVTFLADIRTTWVSEITCLMLIPETQRALEIWHIISGQFSVYKSSFHPHILCISSSSTARPIFTITSSTAQASIRPA
jgi:hypothetical protein